MPRAATRGPELQRSSQRHRIPDHNRQLEHISRTHMRISSFSIFRLQSNRNTPARRSGPHLNPNRRNRTEANKCEHERPPKPTVPAQPPLTLFSAANKPNPAEQNRTGPNAETIQNVPKIFHFCPPRSHDLPQNTGFPRLDRPKEKFSRNARLEEEIAQREHAVSPWFRI